MRVTNFTPDEILKFGLELTGYELDRHKHVKRQSHVKNFKRMYGSHPDVYQAIWVDLQLIWDLEYWLVVGKDPWKDLKYFLFGIHFLRKYSDDNDASNPFKCSDGTLRDNKWRIVRGIQHLKNKKVKWPKEWEAGPSSAAYGDIPVFLVSVNGIHCFIQEPNHGRWLKNPAYYSHKFKKAALSYEVALSVYQNKVLSINGPFPASTNDTTIFNGGIRNKIPRGRLAIVDNGYEGNDTRTSKPNPLDSAEVRKFKGRARSRQECFNSRLKNFKCLKEEFRHGEKKHAICFEAVVVICQYQLENGSPLFDI